MRYKTVPPTPPDEREPIDALERVRDALPLVPRSEDDCCARLVDRVEWIDSRDVATEWIAFLHALGLAEHSDSGYARIRGAMDRESLAARFRERILGAEEICEILERSDSAPDAGDAAPEASREPVTVSDAFDALEPVVPEWERRRSDAWQADWRDHAARCLAWATILGIAEERADGYVRA